MKVNSAEIVKASNHEAGDLKQMLEDAKMIGAQEQLDAHEAEEDVKSLEIELMQAQLAHERKEEAELKGKETSEKIDGLVSSG